MEVSSIHDAQHLSAQHLSARHLAVSYIKPVLSRMISPSYQPVPARKVPWDKIIYTLVSGHRPRTAPLDQGSPGGLESPSVTRREIGRRWIKIGTRLT